MTRTLKSLFTIAGLALLAGCSEGISERAQGVLAMIPHHDHASRRGGPVLMNGNTHFEIVLAKSGEHAVLFSDEYRKPIPASRILDATLVVMREGAPAETLALDPASGEEGAWVAYGMPIDGASVEARVTYRPSDGEPYTIDVPITLEQAHAHAH